MIVIYYHKFFIVQATDHLVCLGVGAVSNLLMSMAGTRLQNKMSTLTTDLKSSVAWGVFIIKKKLSNKTKRVRILPFCKKKIFTCYKVTREYQRGKYHCTIDLLFDWFGISCMTTDNFLLLFAKQTYPNQSRSMVQ